MGVSKCKIVGFAYAHTELDTISEVMYGDHVQNQCFQDKHKSASAVLFEVKNIDPTLKVGVCFCNEYHNEGELSEEITFCISSMIPSEPKLSLMKDGMFF